MKHADRFPALPGIQSKVIHKRFHSLLLLCALLFSSCELPDIQLTDLPLSTAETTAEATDTTEPVSAPPTERYTVVFDESETFSNETARKAAERIDPAIRTAVKLLNTVNEEPLPISDCDYDARPKQRDSLKYPLSKEMYDHVLAKVAAFEDYQFFEKDYPGVDLFNIFVSALDALRIDHTELFLYSDAKINGAEFRSGYFMPGDTLTRLCDDRDAIRAEVALCNAVVDRILEKMPEGLSNYEKCCYFILVLAAGNEYDYSDSIVLYDYQAYSAFVKGKAICSGYAQAFYRLCRETGISCWYCRGETPAGRHAWNLLDTEAGPIYLDITWYDTDALREDFREGKEQYLFMTQEDFDYYGYVQERCQ